jgi:hypothetical protein
MIEAIKREVLQTIVRFVFIALGVSIGIRVSLFLGMIQSKNDITLIGMGMGFVFVLEVITVASNAFQEKKENSTESLEREKYFNEAVYHFFFWFSFIMLMSYLSGLGFDIIESEQSLFKDTGLEPNTMMFFIQILVARAVSETNGVFLSEVGTRIRIRLKQRGVNGAKYA